MALKIMIFGGRGSGKDTTFEIMCKYLSNPKQIRLAGYVVNACKALGIDNPTRTDLSFVGQEIGRNMIGKDVWIQMGIKDAKQSEEYDLILTDCRYPNEYDAFIKEGFVPVFIDCEEETRIERVIKRDGTIDMNLLHSESESHYQNFEYTYKLDNNGTIKQLEMQIVDLIYVYFKGGI